MLHLLERKPLSLPEAETRQFLEDTIAWFDRKNDGHMGKWQYCDPLYDNDPAKGSVLWREWAQAKSDFYMLESQANLISKHAPDILRMTGGINTIVDLGPGEKHAVQTNTVPFIRSARESIKSYVSIDLCESYANDAAEIVSTLQPSIKTFPLHQDFLLSKPYYPASSKVLGLCFGGIVGNYAGPQGARDAIPMLVKELKSLRRNLPRGGHLLVGLDANQNEQSLYASYDHPAHAAYEINVLFQIRRDLMPDQSGFKPDQWKYEMAWYPQSYQFCHIAEALEDQHFTLAGREYSISKGDQFVVDNSFKFPVGIFQQAALMAGYTVKASFLDDDRRMALHLLEIS